ncbi:MAG TPA: transglycosylase SLT domain-containing protein [Steroidobacteraceae bacterium]|nr:transglycosylase SLT domain-containing protein [Steroidobacteraceae bacterium]
MRWLSSLLVAILAANAGVGAARAGIYSYVDPDGGVHYSNVPSDRRYALVLADETKSVAAGPEGAGRLAERETQYAAIIDRAATEAKVPPELLRAVITVESAYDTRAVSAKGAQGLMQLRPATAARYGVRRPFDPAENVRGGARYLADLLKRYANDLTLTLAAYNAGEEAVERYGRAVPPYAETRAYVPSVLGFYRKLLARTGRDYLRPLRDPT